MKKNIIISLWILSMLPISNLLLSVTQQERVLQKKNYATVEQKVTELLQHLKSEDTEASVLELINSLREENEKMQQKIVTIKSKLATMRTTGGGKGAFKPDFKQQADKLLADLRRLDQEIRNNNLKISQILAENNL